MDSQHDSNKTPVSLFPDPFASTSFANPPSNTATPVAASNPLSTSQPQNLFTLASPSPSTPARIPFNPDDFLVSPPHHTPRPPTTSTARATPELKRRLFVAADNAPSAPVTTNPTTATPSSTPAIATSSSVIPTSLPFSSPTVEQIPSPNISFTFSPPRGYLGDLLQSTNNLTARTDTPTLVSNALDTPLPDPMDTQPGPTSLIKSDAQPERTNHALDPASLQQMQTNAAPPPLPPPQFGEATLLPLSDELLTPSPTLDAVTLSHLKAQQPSSSTSKLDGNVPLRAFPGKDFGGVGNPARTLFMPNSQSHPVPPRLPTTPFTPATVSQKVRCSCKASRCLKLYCLCFANSGYCSDGCSCKNCQNTMETPKAVHEARETVLARDPRAFDPKVRLSVSGLPGGGGRGSVGNATPGRPVSDIHAKGCNCRKGCSKKYCVCRELKVECGPRCTCSGPRGCQNRHVSRGEGSTVGARVSLPNGGGKSMATPVGLAFRTPEGKDVTLGPKGRGKAVSKRKVKKRLRNEDGRALGSGDENVMPQGLEKRLKREGMPMGNGNGQSSRGSGALVTCGGIGDGPIQALELVGLDMERSPTVGMGDDVEDFRELIGGVGVRRRVGSGDVVSNVVEEVLGKSSGPRGVLSMVGKDANGMQVAGGIAGITKREDNGQPMVQEGVPFDGGTVRQEGDEADIGKSDGGDGEGTQRGAGGLRMFGRETDGIEVCRLPRILRVKMGSGRLLGNYGV